MQVLAVGRLHPVKNYTFLLKVCRAMLARGLPFHCRIVGEGPERAQLESLIENWSLQQHVVLLGHIARGDLPSLYDEADVVVLTSHSEGIPLVLMEAMARGQSFWHRLLPESRNWSSRAKPDSCTSPARWRIVWLNLRFIDSRAKIRRRLMNLFLAAPKPD